MSTLKIESFRVKIADRYLVDVSEFSFEKGFSYVIFGKSGAGKSTFLKALGSLIPYEGFLYLNEENLLEKYPLEEIRKKVHYIRQVPEFIPGSVIKNFEFILGFRANRNLSIDKSFIGKLLSKFDLSEDILQKDVKNLSGGEKQRISVIRSLFIKPEFILLDEPTSALDIHTESLFIDFLNKIKSETGVIMVSHSVNVILDSDKKLFFENGKLHEVDDDLTYDGIKSMIGAEDVR